MTLRTASNEGSSNDAEWGARAASILHQTPGWRWRRELCLTERSQQRQSGPTTKSWRRLPARQRRDACERHRQSTSEKQCQRPERNACRGGNVGRVRGIVRARPESTARAAWKDGACGWHCQARAGCTARTRSTREWTTLFQRTWQTTELQRQETCGQHRLGTRRWQRQSECGWHCQAASSGRVRVAPLKLDRPIVRALPVHNDGGVSRYRA